MPRFDFIAAYIVANKRSGARYTASTADLVARIAQHKSGNGSLFTSK